MIRFCTILLSIICVFLISAGCSSSQQAMSPIRPPALQQGETIAVIAPGHPLIPERVERACKRLQDMGFQTKIVGDVYDRWGYLAGSDQARVQALMDAWKDPNVRAIFCGTGGYGCTRILDDLDYDLIRANPKILLGFSDVTALNLAINKKTGLICFHGPNLMWGLGSEGRNLTPYASRQLWNCIASPSLLEYLHNTTPGENNSEPVPGISGRPMESETERLTFDLSLLPEGDPRPIAIRKGSGTGRLVGGNFSLVAASMGTNWEIDTDGAILFLEDVNEAPYRIDRYLRQLKQGGKLDNLSGVILGKWRKCTPDDPTTSLTLEEVFEDYFGKASYPVVLDFPLGHVTENGTIPVGATAELIADSTVSLRILVPPTASPSNE